MKTLTNKNWWAAALVRCLKTVAQTMIATIGCTAVLSEIDFKVVLSSAVVSGLLSLLTSIAGLPEVENEEIIEGVDSEDEADG